MKVVKNSPEVRKLYRQSLKWHNEKFDKLTGIKKVGKKMKLFTPENQETYRIKKIVSAIKKAIVHLNVVAVVLIFISCGSDDIMNNVTVPPVSVDLLKVDSITAYATVNPVIDSSFTISNTSMDSLKIEFTAETNATQSQNPFLSIDVSDTLGNFFNITLSDLSDFHGYTVYTKSHNFDYNVTVHLRLSPIAITGYYVRVKNLHITKVQ